MKADQQITKEEIYNTRLALQLAMADIGQTTACDWLSSRQGKQPKGLTGVLGGSGCFNSHKVPGREKGTEQ